MATYVPILGDFSAESFSLVNGAPTAVARDATAELQGSPRPGKMKWVLDLLVPDADAPNETSYLLKVLSPYAYTDALFATEANSFSPIAMIFPKNLLAGICAPAINFQYAAPEEGTQLIPVLITISNPQNGQANFHICIDFSHTAIS